MSQSNQNSLWDDPTYIYRDEFCVGMLELVITVRALSVVMTFVCVRLLCNGHHRALGGVGVRHGLLLLTVGFDVELGIDGQRS
jgi:hypothetical protein